MELTNQNIAEYTRQFSYENISDETVERTKKIVLDTLGVGIGAYTSPPSKALRSTYQNTQSQTNGTIIGSSHKVSVEYAALVNSALIRYLDYNDAYMTRRGGCHPSEHIGALIAMAEVQNASGEELIEAIVLAYELEGACTETGLAWEHDSLDYVLWGAISSVASVGKLMDLSYEELINAIGIAVTANAPLDIARHGDVQMWKGVAHGYVTHNAVQACQMAMNGLTGPGDVFKGPGGLNEHMNVDALEVGELADDTSDEYRVMRTCIKPQITAYMAQSPVEAALEIVNEHGIDASEITTIEIQSYREAIGILADENKWGENITRETADHSMPYSVAAAIVDGELKKEQFKDHRINDPAIHRLMNLIEIEPNEKLAKYKDSYPTSTPSIVTIGTSSEKYTTRVNDPMGHPRKEMPEDFLLEKFEDLVGEYLSKQQQESIIQFCDHLDQKQSLTPLLTSLEI